MMAVTVTVHRENQPRTRVPAMPVLDLAMRMGDHLLASGMSANDVVVQMLRVIRAYGVEHVHVDLTYTSITVTHLRGATRQPLSVLRVVQPLMVDYSKVREIDRLLDRIEDGLGVREATAAYERISHAPHRYPHWARTLGSGGIALGVTLTFSTSLVLLLITFLAGMGGDRLLSLLWRRRVPPFFTQAVVAGFMTFVAAGVAQLRRSGVTVLEDASPTLIVVGGIVMLLAGAMIVGAVQDAIDQFYVTAAARVLEVVMRTGGIVAGILVAVRVLEELGLAFRIVDRDVASSPLWAQYLGVAIIATSFALYCFSDIWTMALMTMVGLLGWTVYTVVEQGSTEVVSNTMAAVTIGFSATLLVRWTNAPGFGMEMGALLPLVPGLTLLNGLLQMTGDPDNPAIVAGGRSLFLAIMVAMGIAAGASLGTYLGRPASEQLRRMRERVRAVRVPVRPPDA
jgi:uncharacterized membrane protein YjjP (DUF1212 family)